MRSERKNAKFVNHAVNCSHSNCSANNWYAMTWVVGNNLLELIILSDDLHNLYFVDVAMCHLIFAYGLLEDTCRSIQNSLHCNHSKSNNLVSYKLSLSWRKNTRLCTLSISIDFLTRYAFIPKLSLSFLVILSLLWTMLFFYNDLLHQ